MSIIKNALAAYAKKSDKVWETDRSQTVGASDVGQCARKVFWMKNEGDPKFGAPRDPDYVDGWGAKVRGTFFEDQFWVPAMRAAYGDKLKWAGSDQNTFVSGFLSATPDALIGDLPSDALAYLGVKDIESDCIVADCKTIDPRATLDGPKFENEFQIHVQIGMVRELTPWKPVYGLLPYTNASFWDDVTEFAIKYDPAVFEGAKRRAAEIMTATSAADLKPEGWIAGGKECENCPFTIACGRRRCNVPADGGVADPQFVAEIADLARQLKFAEAAAGLAEKQVREAQEEIKERLRAKKVRRLVGDGVSVLWSPVKGRTTTDNKRLQEAAEKAGIDLEQFKVTGEPSDRFVVTVSAPSGPEKSQAQHTAAA